MKYIPLESSSATLGLEPALLGSLWQSYDLIVLFLALIILWFYVRWGVKKSLDKEKERKLAKKLQQPEKEAHEKTL